MALIKNEKNYPVKKLNIIKCSEDFFENVEDIVVEEKEIYIYLNSILIEKVYAISTAYKELAAGVLFSRGYSEKSIRESIFMYDDLNKRIDVLNENIVFSPEREIILTKTVIENIVDLSKSIQNKMKAFSKLSGLFSDTGGVHTCSLYHGENKLCYYEDVGRFNTLDKCIGFLILNDIEFDGMEMLFSGRITKGIVKKVLFTNIDLIASFSAPTYGGIEEARKKGLILFGFVRNSRCNIYNFQERNHD